MREQKHPHETCFWKDMTAALHRSSPRCVRFPKNWDASFLHFVDIPLLPRLVHKFISSVGIVCFPIFRVISISLRYPASFHSRFGLPPFAGQTAWCAVREACIARLMPRKPWLRSPPWEFSHIIMQLITWAFLLDLRYLHCYRFWLLTCKQRAYRYMCMNYKCLTSPKQVQRPTNEVPSHIPEHSVNCIQIVMLPL